MEAARAEDIVPPGLLEIPSTEDCRGVWKEEAAVLLDGYLRRLVRQEARGRRVLGVLAGRLQATRAYQALGFVRLGDYTRERLGLSGREVQSLSRTAAALEKLPLLARAFDDGRLCWTKARLLATVAGVHSQAGWLEAATRMNGAELQAAVKAERKNAEDECRAAAGTSGDPNDDDEDCGDSIDGEPRALFALRCPRRLPVMWRRMVELARCVAGSELVQWQAAEVIAAEGLTAREVAPPSLGRDAAGDLRYAAGTGRGGEAGGSGDAHGDGKNDDDEYGESLARSRACLDWTPLDDLAPPDIEALATDLDALDAHALDSRMRRVIESMQRTDSQIGRLLFTFFRLTLHRELGFHDSTSYLRDRLGVTVRKARALVRLELRSVHTEPALVEAYRRGDISWLRALVLLPIVSEYRGRAWVDRAQQVTLRRLADEVAWARELSDCASSTIGVAPPPLGCRLGPGIGMIGVPDPKNPGKIVQVQIGAHQIVPVEFATDPSDDGVASVHSESVAGGLGIRDVCDGRIQLEAPASVVALLVDAVRAFTGRGEAPWRGMERLLRHVERTWQSLPRHRDPVFARDGWRCRVPGCSSRRNLHDHHVMFRSRGGSNDRSNRVSVCASHHHHGIHRGVVRAYGKADEAITWQIGLCRGHGPLMVLRDDAYVVTGRQEVTTGIRAPGAGQQPT